MNSHGNSIKDNEPTSVVDSQRSIIFEKKYLCNLCEKVFSTSGNLKNHVSTIHQNYRPFKCTFESCSKEYSNQSRLKVHLRTHIGLKPFICELCLKSFNENGNLKTHQRLHSQDRPFVCPRCGKSYKTNGHLKDHMNIQHLELRKFECKICGSKFGRSSTLKAHVRTHTGEKPFKCPLPECGKFFSEKGNMLIHYKRHAKKLLVKNSNTNDQLMQIGSVRSSEQILPYERESFSQMVTRACSRVKLDESSLKIEKTVCVNIVKEEVPTWYRDYSGMNFDSMKGDDVHHDLNRISQTNFMNNHELNGIFANNELDQSYILPLDG